MEPNRLSGSWLIRPRLWIGTGSTRQGRGRGGDGGTFPIVLGTFPTVSDTYPNVSCMYLECILIIQSVFHQDTSRYIRIHLFLYLALRFNIENMYLTKGHVSYI